MTAKPLPPAWELAFEHLCTHRAPPPRPHATQKEYREFLRRWGVGNADVFLGEPDLPIRCGRCRRAHPMHALWCVACGAALIRGIEHYHP